MIGEFFVATGTFLPSRCLVTKRWIQFTEHLPSTEKKDTYTDTEADGRDL
jgi:hypothetical protein